MSRRDRLERKCKDKSQPTGTKPAKLVAPPPSHSDNNSIVAFPAGSRVSSVSYCVSDTAPISASSVFTDSSLTDSLIRFDGNTPYVSDISPPVLASAKSVRRTSLGDACEFSPPYIASIVEKIRLVDSGCDIVSGPYRTPIESDRTLEYPMMSDDERNIEGERGAHADGLSEDMHTLFRGLVTEFRSAVAMPDRSRDSMQDIELTRQINSLAPHKDGVDIAKYMRKLEADLRVLGFPRRRWKTVLLQKLQSKTASSIVAGLDRDDTNYNQLKDILMDALGSSLTSLGSKLTTEFASTTRSMSPLETYVYLKSLTDSIDMMCGSKEELLLFIACATYGASRPVLIGQIFSLWLCLPLVKFPIVILVFPLTV